MPQLAHLFFGGETVGELLEHQVRIYGGDAAYQYHEHPFHHSCSAVAREHNGEGLRKFQRYRGSTLPRGGSQLWVILDRDETAASPRVHFAAESGSELSYRDGTGTNTMTATVSASALALHLDCSRTYIGRLEAEGVIQRQGDGFPLDQSPLPTHDTCGASAAAGGRDKMTDIEINSTMHFKPTIWH